MDDLARAHELLRSAGATEDELAAATTVDATTRLAGEVSTRPSGRPMSLRDLAAAAGCDVADAQRLLRAGGLAADDVDAVAWFSSDVEWIAASHGAEELFGSEAVEMLLRRAGGAMSQLASAASSVFRATQWSDLEGQPPHEIVGRNLASRPLVDLYLQVCGQLYRYHARLGFREESTAASELAEVRELAVGFVDVVASTEWTAAVAVDELSRWINRFTTIAYDSATRAGARIVKTIGDEVMLSALSPEPVVRVALELVEFCARSPDVRGARAGIATGPVLEQDGDHFGPVVNRAARFVAEAPDGAVMIDAAAGPGLAAGFAVGPATPVELRGIGTAAWCEVAASSAGLRGVGDERA